MFSMQHAATQALSSYIVTCLERRGVLICLGLRASACVLEVPAKHVWFSVAVKRGRQVMQAVATQYQNRPTGNAGCQCMVQACVLGHAWRDAC